MDSCSSKLLVSITLYLFHQSWKRDIRLVNFLISFQHLNSQCWISLLPSLSPFVFLIRGLMEWWERGHREFWGWSLQILKWWSGVMLQTSVTGKIKTGITHLVFFPNHRVPFHCTAPQSTPPHLLSLQNVTYQGTAPFLWIDHAPHLHLYFQCEIYILGCTLLLSFTLKMATAIHAETLEQLQHTTQLNPESQKYILHNRSQKPNDDKWTLIQSGK